MVGLNGKTECSGGEMSLTQGSPQEPAGHSWQGEVEAMGLEKEGDLTTRPRSLVSQCTVSPGTFPFEVPSSGDFPDCRSSLILEQPSCLKDNKELRYIQLYVEIYFWQQ